MNEVPVERRFLGGLMIAAGGLVAALCGLCTGYVQLMFINLLWTSAPSRASPYDTFATKYLLEPLMLLLPTIVGTVPILAGVTLIVWGLRVSRGTDRR